MCRAASCAHPAPPCQHMGRGHILLCPKYSRGLVCFFQSHPRIPPRPGLLLRCWDCQVGEGRTPACSSRVDQIPLGRLHSQSPFSRRKTRKKGCDGFFPELLHCKRYFKWKETHKRPPAHLPHTLKCLYTQWHSPACRGLPHLGLGIHIEIPSLSLLKTKKEKANSKPATFTNTPLPPPPKKKPTQRNRQRLQTVLSAPTHLPQALFPTPGQELPGHAQVGHGPMVPSSSVHSPW